MVVPRLRMDDSRLPKAISCSELEEGTRSRSGQRKRYKDTLKANLKRCDIAPPELEDWIGPSGDCTARPQSSSLKQVMSGHWKPSGNIGRQGYT